MLTNLRESGRTGAFTLVEVLIVVLILGILAAIVIPQVTNASSQARDSMLADNLRILRSQIILYTHQHIEVPPGYPDGDTTQAPTQNAFLDQMTLATDANGTTAAVGTPGFRYGPYFTQMVANPINGKATVEVITDGAAFPGAGDNSHGYIYKPHSLTLKADTPGADKDGKLYFDY